MKMKITVQGVSYDVEVDVVDGAVSTVAPSAPRVTTPSAPSAAPIAATPSAPTAAPSASGDKAINAPVGGTIVSIAVKAGDKVATGSELLILEAMKMQTSIASPVDGVVKKVHVSSGDVVRDNQILVEFE